MFFFAYFLIFSFSIRHRHQNRGASYPIDRGLCYANLNGELYNLTEIEGATPYTTIFDKYKYYIRFCKELSPQDFTPPAQTTFDYSDVYAARCNDTICEALITENSWDWRYLNSSEKDKGVLYYGMGEPFLIAPDTYFTFDIEVKFICDPKKSPGQDFTVIFDSFNTTETTMRLRTSNRLGCSKPVATPTPTPSPFNPQCNYTDRYDDMPNYGVDFHLQNMNSGPYGVRGIVSGDGQYVVFYQPCERMKCPPDYTCNLNDNLSSVWLCDQQRKTCESYGSVNNNYESFIEPYNPEELLDGIKLTYNHSDATQGSAQILLKCTLASPNNHFLFNKEYERNGNNISFTLHTSNVCPKIIPDPTPPPSSQCFFNGTNSDMKSTITLNLTSHDEGQMHGWKSNVTYGINKQGTLYYEPCDNIMCPPDAFCEGDEDATVYLCHDGDDGKPDCIGYGLLENEIQMSFKDNYDITDGVSVLYRGDFRRYARVNWACDKTLQPNTVKMPTEVKLNGHEVSFTVWSKEACASGDPTPRPPYHPPRPKRPTKPTPTPQPSVNPNDIYMINDTHFIITPLQNYQQKVHRGNITLLGPSHQESTIYVEFHPWDLIKCPTGWVCSAGHTESNFWACWVDDDNTKYCHSIGDVRILNEMKPRTPTNPDAGAELHFGGVWGLDVYIDIECDPLENNYSIPFDHASVLSYQTSLQGPRFMMYLDSGAVCPRQFYKPEIPQYIPRQTPKPGFTPTFTYTSEPNEDGKVIHIDLEGLPHYYDELITVGQFPDYQRNLYRYYPVQPGLPPSGSEGFQYTILDNEHSNENTLANIWRCFNTSDGRGWCHSAGNALNNLDYVLVNRTNLNAGISLNYDGGYSGWETHIQLICNESVPATKIDFDDIGVLIPSNKSPIIFAHTSMACLVDPPKPTPIPIVDDRNGVTAGAVFLFVVVVVGLVYVFAGVLFGFIRYGSIDLPNKQFWEEFGQCLQTAILFIFTCGKRTAANITYKETI